MSKDSKQCQPSQVDDTAIASELDRLEEHPGGQSGAKVGNSRTLEESKEISDLFDDIQDTFVDVIKGQRDLLMVTLRHLQEILKPWKIPEILQALQTLRAKALREEKPLVPLGLRVTDRAFLLRTRMYANLAHATYHILPSMLRRDVRRHAGMTVEYLKMSGSSYQPAFFLATSPHTKEVIVCIRGTVGLSDIITDLTAEPTRIVTGGHVHPGLYHCALYLLVEHGQKIYKLLKENPEYNLTLVGHSLGAGTAALFTYIVNTMYRERFTEEVDREVDVRAVCFATPATMCKEISEECRKKGWVTSFVLDTDIVPRLSVFNMVRLEGMMKTAAKNLSDKAKLVEEAKPSSLDKETRPAFNPLSTVKKVCVGVGEGGMRVLEEGLVQTQDSMEKMRDWAADPKGYWQRRQLRKQAQRRRSTEALSTVSPSKLSAASHTSEPSDTCATKGTLTTASPSETSMMVGGDNTVSETQSASHQTLDTVLMGTRGPIVGEVSGEGDASPGEGDASPEVVGVVSPGDEVIASGRQEGKLQENPSVAAAGVSGNGNMKVVSSGATASSNAEHTDARDGGGEYDETGDEGIILVEDTKDDDETEEVVMEFSRKFNLEDQEVDGKEVIPLYCPGTMYQIHKRKYFETVEEEPTVVELSKETQLMIQMPFTSLTAATFNPSEVSTPTTTPTPTPPHSTSLPSNPQLQDDDLPNSLPEQDLAALRQAEEQLNQEVASDERQAHVSKKCIGYKYAVFLVDKPTGERPVDNFSVIKLRRAYMNHMPWRYQTAFPKYYPPQRLESRQKYKSFFGSLLNCNADAKKE